jgi:hypothetical protein
VVPKGRFELPRPYGHYALNVARLPFRHFGVSLFRAHQSISSALSRAQPLAVATKWLELIGLIGMSWRATVVWKAKEFIDSRTSRQPGIELLMRPGCHLCEDAYSALGSAFGRANIRLTDITSGEDPALEDEFVFRIPIVRYREHVLAEGIVTKYDARRIKRAVYELHAGSAHG